MKSGRTLVEMAQELQRQNTVMKDYLVPSPLMHHKTDPSGTAVIGIEEQTGTSQHGITAIARKQLAEKLKIPFQYFERMRETQPALLDTNVNTWLQNESDKRLVRTLDGNVRAVLSDRYRRLDNFALAEHVLPILHKLQEAEFASLELTETKMYIKVVTPRLSYEMTPGDVVQAGLVISNSEIGMGTLTIQPLLFRLVCKNGLIVADKTLRKTHLGRVIDSPDNIVSSFKDETLRADDRAFFLMVRDVIEATVAETTFLQSAQKMQATLGIALKGNPTKAVEVLGKRHDLSADECGGVLRHLINEGSLTGYGMVGAVTRYSQEVANYDRATEFEMLGGKLIDMDASEWKEIAEAE